MKIFKAAFFIGVLFFLISAASPPNNDAHINKQVKIRLVLDRSIHLQKIQADTQNGVVSLKGVTDAKTQATRAIEIATSTPGVTKVNATELFVKDSQQPLQDSYITAKIKGLYWKNNLTRGAVNVPWFEVKVETQNGVVYLSGRVQNKTQRQQAMELAQSVEGVQRVDSSLEIKA